MGGITSALQCVCGSQKETQFQVHFPSTKQHLWDRPVTLALFSVCQRRWIIGAKETTLPLFFASSSGFISRWAAGALELTGEVFAWGLLGLQGCSADHCRPSDLSGVPGIGLGFPSKDSFCCSGLLPSVRKHQIMTVAGSTGNMDDKVMGGGGGHDLFLVCFHADNNAFHCKQSKDCFSRVPRRLENILEIERTLYLESEAPGWPWAATHHLWALVSSPRKVMRRLPWIHEKIWWLFVCFSHSVKA